MMSSQLVWEGPVLVLCDVGTELGTRASILLEPCMRSFERAKRALDAVRYEEWFFGCESLVAERVDPDGGRMCCVNLLYSN